jgi:hypothetical protein
MSEGIDERLGRLLREDAPSDGSALFRLGVLERRERQRFRTRSIALAFAALVLAAIVGIGFNAGIDLVATAAIAILCALLALAFLVSAPGVALLLHRLRRAGRN